MLNGQCCFFSAYVSEDFSCSVSILYVRRGAERLACASIILKMLVKIPSHSHSKFEDIFLVMRTEQQTAPAAGGAGHNPFLTLRREKHR